MAVLHVIDWGRTPGNAGEFLRRVQACAVLLREAHHAQSVVIIGPGSAAQIAAELGLPVQARISPPLGNAAGAWMSLRRLIDANGRPDALMCWGVGATRLAHRAVGDAVPRIAVVPEGEASPECDRLVVYGASAGRRLESEGASVGQILVVSPPVAHVPRGERTRSRVRQMLGCNDKGIVVLAVGAPGRVDAVRFGFVMGLLAVGGVRVRGVMGPGAVSTLRASRLSAAEPKLRVIASERPMSELMAAADIALFDGGGCGTATSHAPTPWTAPEPILSAHGAGVPVVAPIWVNEDGLYAPEAAPSLLAHNSSLPELARKMAALVEDPERRIACSEAVGRDVQRRQCESRFAAQCSELWESLVEDPVGTERGL